MNGINPQISRPAFRSRFPPLPNGYLHRPRLLIGDSPLPVSLVLAQIVKVRYRDRRQPPVPFISVFVKLSVQNLLRRWAAECSVCLVHCSQQLYVGPGVVPCKLVPVVTSHLHLAVFHVSRDQPRHLSPA